MVRELKITFERMNAKIRIVCLNLSNYFISSETNRVSSLCPPFGFLMEWGWPN